MNRAQKLGIKLTDDQKQKLHDYGVPSHMHGGVIRYVEDGLPPGDFLSAVINNDLKEACARADDWNKQALFSYVMWFYNCAPAGCWGHSSAIKDWCSYEEA